MYRDGKVALKGIPSPAVDDAYMTEDGVSQLLDDPKPFADRAFATILEQYQNYLYND